MSVRPSSVVRPVVTSRKLSKIDRGLLWNTESMKVSKWTYTRRLKVNDTVTFVQSRKQLSTVFGYFCGILIYFYTACVPEFSW